MRLISNVNLFRFRISDLSPLQPVETVIPPVVSTPSPRQQQTSAIMGAIGSKRKSLGLDNPESLSLFSSINGYHNVRNPKPPVPTGKIVLHCIYITERLLMGRKESNQKSILLIQML